MLKSLHVRNYAIIDDLNVEFGPGLNILTGETGAGKSILIDALGLVLGERASSDAVRGESEKSIVEAVFAVPENKHVAAFLTEHDLDTSDELILRREISARGTNRCFINDTPVNVADLKDLGNHLVDLHGQHEHQSLLRPETHLELLDDFGGLERLLQEYREPYLALSGLFQRWDDLKNKEEKLQERRELYRFQIDEIDAVSPEDGEEDALNAELVILENAEKLFEATSKMYEGLYESEQAVYDQLVLARNQLEDLSSIDKTFTELRNECAAAAEIVREITKALQSYNSKIEFNPARLEEIRERLGHLSLLKKKYGGSVQAIVEHRRRIGEEVELAENFEEELRKIEAGINEQRQHCSRSAERLSTKRRELAGRIANAVKKELHHLGIPHVEFEAVFTNRPLKDDVQKNGSRHVYVKVGPQAYEATARGFDLVEFFISTNPGESPRPLSKVASGGEVSRVMLALKSVLAKSERLPLLIFDEIDVGVSGRVAQKVGRSLQGLSQFHQVIAITHLPQIAGLADAHYVVEKKGEGRRTVTRVRRLELEERVTEVAKLLSGEEVTQAGIDSARELMKEPES